MTTKPLNAIYLRDDIYVPVADYSSSKLSIFKAELQEKSSVFGGRVMISNCADLDGDLRQAILSIDGVKLYRLKDGRVLEYLPINRIVSHLNAIESFGIATFLKNYEESVNFLYKELTEAYVKKERLLSQVRDEERKLKLLKEIEGLEYDLTKILDVVHALRVRMESGLRQGQTIAVQEAVQKEIG